MKTTILRDSNALRTLEATWRAHEAPTPFHSWAYLEAWLSQSPRGSTPFVVVVSDDAGWVALALWSIVRDNLGIRRLTGMGGDDGWYHDPWLLRPEHEAAVGKILGEALHAARREWDMLALVLQDAVSPTLIRELENEGLAFSDRVEWRQQQTASLGEDWTAYWHARPKQFRELIRRRGKKLAALDHRFVEADPSTLDPLLERLFTLHRERWGSERDWSGYYRMIRAIASEALKEGRLCFYGIEAEGRLIALELLIRCGDRSFELLRIIDPAPEFAPLSAGSLLTAWAFERMHLAGVREVDMGPGRNEWKAGLETHRTGTVLQVAARPGRLPAMAMATWLGALKPLLRQSDLAHRLKERLSALQKLQSRAAAAP